MASLSQEKNGGWRVLFLRPGQTRGSVRLGKMPEAEAREIAGHIEHLWACQVKNRPCSKVTERWVTSIYSDPAMQWLYDRMAAAGLVTPREGTLDQRRAAPKLGSFLREYIDFRVDLKPSTRRHLEQVRERLVEYFGEETLLENITPGDTDEWRRWLGEKLGENTIRRFCGRGKQFFRAAVRKRAITQNPFFDMKNCTVQANRGREFFITQEVAERVLEACPDAEWRLIFALARYAGLRTPSETLALTWSDVDWERNRMTIQSPKTERYAGKDSRVIPIFPELRPFLDEAFEQAESGTVHVINRYRDTSVNLRTQMLRILKRASIEPWEKLFQNLRASRATELAAEFPSHVAAAWLGHSTLVAQKHYWQVTEADFDKAAHLGAKSGTIKGSQVPSTRGDSGQENSKNIEKNRVFLNEKAPPVGLEPTTQRLTAACSTD